MRFRWILQRGIRRRFLALVALCVIPGLFVCVYFFSNPMSFRLIHKNGSQMDTYPSMNHSTVQDVEYQQGNNGFATTTDKSLYSKDKIYYSHGEEHVTKNDKNNIQTMKVSDSRNDAKHLQDTVVKISSGLDSVSNKVNNIQHFTSDYADLFSSVGDNSDYIFPPCEEDTTTFQNSPMYGFVGPFRYLANYKNPCWMEQGNGEAPVVFCVPYFYLVGAPKAGSTDVYKRITLHPEVVKPVSKETRWFDRARFANEPHFSSFLNNFYLAAGTISSSLSKGTNFHSRIVGDGSPSYFFDNRQWPFMPGNEGCSEPRVTVASHIHHLFPKARIIFILRNPVDRLYSSYLYNHAKYEIVSSSLFDQHVREAINLYNNCFARHSVRQCANNATVFQQSKVMLVVSLYHVFVQDWIKLFPRNQLLFMSTEKYHLDMADHLNRIYTFLGLRPLNSTEMPEITGLKKQNTGFHYKRTGPMLAETRTLLENFYRPYNMQLARLLNNPEFLWMD